MSFFRIIKFSLQDMGRNISLSFMTVFILVLMLLSINTLLGVRILTDQAISGIKDQLDVSIHFNYEAEDSEVEEVVNFASAFPEVTETEFLDRDQVLEQFQNTYKDNENIVASLEVLEKNPLGPMLILKTKEPLDYEKVIKALSIPEYETIIETKTFGDTQKAIERIHVVTSQVENFTLFLTSLFAIIAFVIIFNTVRVAIYTHRIEISIKKLVGASNWFVRGPYIVESFIFSIISILLAGGIIWLTLSFIDPYISVIFQSGSVLTNYYSSHIIELVSLQFGAVLLLTVLTSSLAMRRYLKV